MKEDQGDSRVERSEEILQAASLTEPAVSGIAETAKAGSPASVANTLAPMEIIRMAMSSFLANPMQSVKGTAGCVEPNDARLSKYIQGIRDAEVQRHMRSWIANGTPEIAASRNAEMYVQRTLDSGPLAVHLYLAAVRALKNDEAMGGSAFEASVKQGAMELSAQLMQASAGVAPPSWQQAYLASANIQAVAAPPPTPFARSWNAPPPPPISGQQPVNPYYQPFSVNVSSSSVSQPASKHAVVAASGASWLTESATSPNDIAIPRSTPATRILAMRWLQSTFSKLQGTIPAGLGTSQDEWLRRICCFMRVVVEGQSRLPEEGAAMRWLMLPVPKAALVKEVSDNVERYREVLPGYHELQAADTGAATGLQPPPPASATSQRKLWTPAKSVQTQRSLSMSSVSSSDGPSPPLRLSSALKRASEGASQKKKKNSGRRVHTDDTFIPLPDELPAAFTKVRIESGRMINPLLDDECLPPDPKRLKVDTEERRRREDRAKRFSEASGSPTSCGTSYTPVNIDSQPMTWKEKLMMNSSTAQVVGRSSALEKQYLRLCGAPDPSTVRSEKALSASFFHVATNFFRRIECTDSANLPSAYRYIEEQLRSIRQDYVVQGIKSPFLYFVYAINSRISQIFHDYGQFNQTHSQLKQLEKRLPHSLKAEFVAHRLVYAALNSLDAEIHKLLQVVDAERFRQTSAVRFAMAIRNNIAEANYCRFMRLSQDREGDVCEEQRAELAVVRSMVENFASAWNRLREAEKWSTDEGSTERKMLMISEACDSVWATSPKVNGAPAFCRSLLRAAVPRIQMMYLCNLSKANYSVPVETLTGWLRMSTTQRCRDFLKSQNAIFADEGKSVVDCRQSLNHFMQSSLLSKKVKAMG